ncbi:MAG: UvrY/SirA/GacA family response regulator transcription factor [Stenotrophobium sp.]
MIRIMLVDDHRLVRAGLRRFLMDVPDMEIIAEACTGEQALEFARVKSPNVILMDINMPGIGGLESTRRIKLRQPEVKIIVVSMHLEEPYPSRMLAAGASGYISKDSGSDEVVAAIRRVVAGGHYVAPEVAGNLAASLVKGAGNASPFEQLSQRETQVMLMVTQGYSTQNISEHLHLSPKTVSTYRYRLFEKLGISNDVELTRMAMRYGLLDEKPEISQIT